MAMASNGRPELVPSPLALLLSMRIKLTSMTAFAASLTVSERAQTVRFTVSVSSFKFFSVVSVTSTVMVISLVSPVASVKSLSKRAMEVWNHELDSLVSRSITTRWPVVYWFTMRTLTSYSPSSETSRG